MSTIADTYLLETIKSLKGLKSTAEKAIEQVDDKGLFYQKDEESNSIAVIMKHMSGNMMSRFTDFLTTDGEKANRNRDYEFVNDKVDRDELMKHWQSGWDCLFVALSELNEGDLLKSVFIRNEEHSVIRALNRQLVHYSYHTGQIVYICKEILSDKFKTLSIPRNKNIKA